MAAIAPTASLLVIVTAAIACIVNKQRSHIPIVAGIVMYLVYVVVVGGDFMAGRFLTAPLFLAVVLLSRDGLRLEGLWWLLPFTLIIVMSLCSPCPPLPSGADYTGEASDEWDERWIADARGFYYQETGLLRATRIVKMSHS